MELCLFAQENNFSSDYEAENALDRILNVIGASKTFALTPIMFLQLHIKGLDTYYMTKSL